MTAIERLVAIAQAEIGYLEKATNAMLDDKTANAGSNNYTKYARNLDAIGNFYNGPKNGYAWCDVFVDWCMWKTFGLEMAKKLLCQPDNSLGAGCTYSAGYYKSNGRFFYSGPQVGDQIFFTSDGGKTCYHTGLVTEVKNGRVYTIEGNTSSASGVVPNGGAVAAKSYNVTSTSIAGYGRPDYSIIEEECDMTKEEVKQLIQSEVKAAISEVKQAAIEAAKEAAPEIVRAYRTSLQDNDASAWSQADRDRAVASGLFVGSGNADTGEQNYMWEDFLTREQAATLLNRQEDRIMQMVEKIIQQALVTA